jgi:hypothetical protein
MKLLVNFLLGVGRRPKPGGVKAIEETKHRSCQLSGQWCGFDRNQWVGELLEKLASLGVPTTNNILYNWPSLMPEFEQSYPAT